MRSCAWVLSAYAGFFELAVVFYGCCGDIYVDASDSTVFVFDGINCFYALEYILNGVIYRVLARLDCKALMSHILKCGNLFDNFFLRELFTCNVLVFHMIRAINTAVHAVI